jgi:hypothetical protein
MRGLKALVIGMGILIVAGIVVLIFAIADRAGQLAEPGPSFAPQTVALPPGAEIVETGIGDGRVVLRLRLADGTGRLVLLDADSGRVTGTIDLQAP